MPLMQAVKAEITLLNTVGREEGCLGLNSGPCVCSTSELGSKLLTIDLIGSSQDFLINLGNSTVLCVLLKVVWSDFAFGVFLYFFFFRKKLEIV